MSGAAVDVLVQIDSLISVAAIEGKFVDADYAMRDAIVELMEAAREKQRVTGGGAVVTAAESNAVYRRLEAALRRCQGAQE